MNQKTQNRSYKDTIQRPRTSFAMKANLVQREPTFQKRWQRLDLYNRMRQQEHPRGPFVFHDGPPYANGDIHIGHLLNKVLKDLVVRTRLMAGYDVDFVPGWDCHGLPIEHKVLKEQAAADGDDALKTRRKCRKYAEKYVKLQSRQMQRLGTVGRYDDPYLTMDPAYEAAVLEVFARLVEAGLVYRRLKPVHWSIENQTALAEAELEYIDREDTSVYVEFELDQPGHLPAALNAPAGPRVALMIWTTTPWTLPANVAVAVSEQAEYSLFAYDRDGQKRYVIMAEDLHKQVFEREGLETAEGHRRLGTCPGSELVGLTYRHPFAGRVSPVVAADYVTLEDGTGLVHTAPGHGVEDYQTGLREGLEIYCPVQADGTFDATAPDWLVGKSVWEANDRVTEHLRASGHLFHDHRFSHSYPHDWRSKTPVIFRATEQWFVSVDTPFRRDPESDEKGASLRDRAMAAAAEDVAFIPAWGRNRMRGMLENAPDWCISRQRAWGLPIPAFSHKQTGQPLLTPESVRHVAGLFAEKGSDVWFTASAEDLLEGCAGVDDPSAWAKGGDILDVWFESGSSWNPVLNGRDLGYPADLYLEGSDQHRGWFQKALVTSLGATGASSFRALLTHGFMVDARGQKMSKSGGNAINVEDLMTQFGADVCRWWVAGLNYANDVKVDMAFFRLAGEEYRKVRNTIRFLLGNLPSNDTADSNTRRPLTDADANSIDAWARQQLSQLIDRVSRAYDQYNFRVASEAIFNFCNDAMSTVYLAAVKDRLYCDAVDSDRRRRTQTVLGQIADALIRLVAPILVHTADEAWLALHGLAEKADQTVHTHRLPEPIGYRAAEGWDAVMALRDRVLKALEDARAQRGIDNPLDAGVTVMLEPEPYAVLAPFEPELADLCGVSRFELVEDGQETIDIADLRDQPRCERSWKRDGTVSQRSDGGWLSDRDARAVGVA